MSGFHRVVCLILCCLLLPGILVFTSNAADVAANVNGGMSVTVKYEGGGHWSKYSMQEAGAGAPAVADLDGDGRNEIVFCAQSIYCLDGATGEIKWRAYSGKDTATACTEDYGPNHGRATIAPQIIDIDGDGRLDVVTVQTNYAEGSSCVAVYDANGRFKPGWPVYVNPPVYALKVADLDGDGKMEFCLGFGVGQTGKDAIMLYNSTGTKLWAVKNGFGLYSNSIEAADLNGDGKLEVFGLYDDDDIFAYDINGKPVAVTGDASGLYGGVNNNGSPMTWKGLPICEGFAYESKCAEWARNHGGTCCAWSDQVLGTTRAEKNCLAGTHGGVVATDVDGDGTVELVFTGLIADGSKIMRGDANSYEGVALYFTTFILNSDRTRYKNAELGYDWTQMPIDTGSIISMDNPNMAAFPDITPTVADLDGDGAKEILYTSPDGLMHCFSLDGREHDGWPYNLNPDRGKAGWVTEYATGTSVADVDGDGQLEVIFASYTDKTQTTKRGSLYILDCHGNLLAKQAVPTMWGSDKGDFIYANGCIAKPAVADVDNDGALEIALTTLSAGVVVYEINRTPFNDIPANSWYTGACAWCYRKGFMAGTSGNTFSPSTPLSRAMFVQILAKVGNVYLDGYRPTGTFKDVPAGSWFAKAVEWAYANKITGGTSATAFSPNSPVTREQMSLFLMKFSELEGADTSMRANLDRFVDLGRVSVWARDSMSWAVARGLISGTSPTELSPKTYATRAQTAVVIRNYIRLK